MPPDKNVVEERPPLIGRIGTNLKMGILGLPNVGKSTFFNVLTKSSIPVENFPFCTIDPNEARVMLQDKRFDWLVEHFKTGTTSKVPAFLNVVDIAGLVKGASEGQGRGNAFLSHVSACDALFHLCRAFDDDDVIHVEGDVNPTRDLDIIANELIQKDLQYLEPVVRKLESLVVKAKDKTKQVEYDCMKKVQTMLLEKRPPRLVKWNEKEIDALNKHLLLTSKPIVYLVNLTEKDYIRKKNKWLPKIKEWIDKNDPGAVFIPFSGVFESKLIDMPDDERAKFLKENEACSNLDKIVQIGFKTLQLEYFFTAGEKEVNSWIIQKGTKAPQAAGRIHGDFEKGQEEDDNDEYFSARETQKKGSEENLKDNKDLISSTPSPVKSEDKQQMFFSDEAAQQGSATPTKKSERARRLKDKNRWDMREYKKEELEAKPKKKTEEKAEENREASKTDEESEEKEETKEGEEEGRMAVGGSPPSATGDEGEEEPRPFFQADEIILGCEEENSIAPRCKFTKLRFSKKQEVVEFDEGGTQQQHPHHKEREISNPWRKHGALVTLHRLGGVHVFKNKPPIMIVKGSSPPECPGDPRQVTLNKDSDSPDSQTMTGTMRVEIGPAEDEVHRIGRVMEEFVEKGGFVAPPLPKKKKAARTKGTPVVVVQTTGGAKKSAAKMKKSAAKMKKRTKASGSKTPKKKHNKGKKAKKNRSGTK